MRTVESQLKRLEKAGENPDVSGKVPQTPPTPGRTGSGNPSGLRHSRNQRRDTALGARVIVRMNIEFEKKIPQSSSLHHPLPQWIEQQIPAIVHWM